RVRVRIHVYVQGRSLTVRGERDATELALVQPVHQTPAAGVDHDIPRPPVVMAVERLSAGRAIQRALAWLLTRRRARSKCADIVGPYRVDDHHEQVHRNQQPTTRGTAQKWLAVQSALPQRRRADRARLRGLPEELELLGNRWPFLLGAAVFAHEQPFVADDSQRRTAISAVRHRWDYRRIDSPAKAGHYAILSVHERNGSSEVFRGTRRSGRADQRGSLDPGRDSLR